MLITLAIYQSNQMFQAKSDAKYVIVNGKKLIPISEYKGPVLKLTKADCKAIEKLQEKIENIEMEHLKIISLLSDKQLSNNTRDYYSDVCIELESQIKTLRDEIEKIKLDRHKKQLAKMNHGTGS